MEWFLHLAEKDKAVALVLRYIKEIMNSDSVSACDDVYEPVERTITISDYCNECGVAEDIYKIKESLEDLSDKSFWFKKGIGCEVLVRPVQKVYINHKNKTITLGIDREVIACAMRLWQIGEQKV